MQPTIRSFLTVATALPSLLCLMMSRPADAQTPTSPPADTLDALETSRVTPRISNRNPWMARAIGLGLSIEQPRYQTENDYEPGGLGYLLSFNEQIRPWFRGGVRLRWSEWRVRADSPKIQQGFSVYPLTIVSLLELSPPPKHLSGIIGGIVRPFLSGGLGYAYFAQSRPMFPPKRFRPETNEFIGAYGAGVRFVWTNHGAIRIAGEQWMGTKSARYAALAWQIELEFGDFSDEEIQ